MSEYYSPKRFEEMAGTVGMHPSWPKTNIQNLCASPPDGSVTVGRVVIEFVNLSILQSWCADSVVDMRRG